MTQLGTPSTGHLSDYASMYSPRGLFLRYARGRVRYAGSRLAFAAFASAILALMTSPAIGAFAWAVVLLSEALEYGLLKRIPELLERGHSLKRLMGITTVTAGMQTGAVATVGSLPLILHHEGAHGFHGAAVMHVEPVFTIGVIASAAINAGLTAPYHKPAALVRLFMLGVFPSYLMMHEVWGTELLLPLLGGICMLAASIWWFMKFALTMFDRNRRDALAQSEQRTMLEVVNKRLQDEELQSRRLALVAEHAHDSVFLVGADGRILWANEAYTRLTGFTLQEAIGKRQRDLMQGDDIDPQAIATMMEAREKGVPCRVELNCRNKYGDLIWLESSQVPVRGPDGEIEMFVAIERDVTAAHLHAVELEAAKRAAEQGERAKADFLATMSHEIRTPMNGVIGMAQMLEETRLDPDQKLYAQTIQSSAQTLLALINDVLDLSKLDADQMEFSNVDFDLRACFQETLQLLKGVARDKGIDLNLQIPDSLPRMMHGDDRRIRQILLNLMGNAIKFTDVGYVQVDADCQEQGADLLLTFRVCDTGIGVSRHKLKHIFERFSQADAATTRRYGGTGLGLAICRKLTEAMGGEIGVTSEEGVGSCFTVTLCLKPAKQDLTALPTDSQEGPIPLAPLEGLKVLVAEDNGVNRLVISKFLRDVPVVLDFAVDGKQAVEKTEMMQPDLVLMDMSMPVMGGVEATRIIRASDGPQPIIVALTANAFDSDREACLQAGMDGFLSKPLSKRDLLIEMHKHATAPDFKATG